jgi:hypothetical protein
MTDTEVKRLNGFLSKTLKMEAEDMASLYNEAGELVSLTAAEKADTARVAKLKEDNESQYKRGQKEVASKLEAKLKDKFEIESELTGVDLVDHILSIEIEKVKGKGAEDITAHPEYLRLKAESDKLLKSKDKEYQAKIAELETNHTKQLMFSKVRDRAFAELDNLRPVLPEDAKKAQRWKEKYIEEFRNYEFKELDGSIVVLKDGKPLQDGHAYDVSFEDLVKTTASEFFDFHTAEQRSSAGNKDKEQRQVAAPKNDDEYVAKIREAKTPEERIKIMESYQTKTK